MNQRVASTPIVGDQLVERHEVAAALGHLRLLAALDDVHELQDRDLERVGVAARARRSTPFIAADVAVVVGAEHVDQPVEAAPDLVLVVGDVGGEVGRRAVERSIRTRSLSSPNARRAQPQRALGLVQVAVLAQPLERDRRSATGRPRAASPRGRTCRTRRGTPRSVARMPSMISARGLAAELGRVALGGAGDLRRRARPRSRPGSRPRAPARWRARARTDSPSLRDLRAGVVEVVLARRPRGRRSSSSRASASP